MAIIKCHYCKETIADKENLEIHKVKETNRKFHKSDECYKKFLFESTHKCRFCNKVIKIDEDYEEVKLKDDSIGYVHDECIDAYAEQRKEIEDWDKLYKYVKFKILQYDECINLSIYQINRLKGLRDGKHILGRAEKSKYSAYPFNIIYLTFLFKTNDILYALKTKQFNSDEHRFDYIMAIVGREINGVYQRVKEQEKANTRLEETTRRLSERKNQEPSHDEDTYVKSTLNKKLIEALNEDSDGLGL